MQQLAKLRLVGVVFAMYCACLATAFKELEARPISAAAGGLLPG